MFMLLSMNNPIHINCVYTGLGHNVSFCRDVMRNDVFRSGNYSTKFIEQEYPEGFKGVQLSKDETNEMISIGKKCHIIIHIIEYILQYYIVMNM